MSITFRHEGGYGIDNNGHEVYCGINRQYNSTWPGWPIVDTHVAAAGGSAKARFQNWNETDPTLAHMVYEWAGTKYYDGHNFDDFNDKRVVCQLFDQTYWGPATTTTILREAFGTTNFATAAVNANNDPQALEKVVQARKAYTQTTGYKSTTPESYRNKCIAVMLKRIDSIVQESGGTQFANPPINNNNQSYAAQKVENDYNNKNVSNWFLYHLGNTKIFLPILN